MLTLHHHPYNYNLTNAAEREEMALIGMSLTQGKVLCSAEPITIILRASTELPPVQFESPIPLTEDGKPILPVKDERSILQK